MQETGQGGATREEKTAQTSAIVEKVKFWTPSGKKRITKKGQKGKKELTESLTGDIARPSIKFKIKKVKLFHAKRRTQG